VSGLLLVRFEVLLRNTQHRHHHIWLRSHCMPQPLTGRAATSSQLGKSSQLQRSTHRHSRAPLTGRCSSLAALPGLLPLLLHSRHVQHCCAIAAAAAACHRAQLHTAVAHQAAWQGASCRCMAAAPLAAADAAANGARHCAADDGCSATLDQLSLAHSEVRKPLPCNSRPPAAHGTAAAALQPAAVSASDKASAKSSAGAAAPAVDQPPLPPLQQPPEPPNGLPWSQSPALRFEVLAKGSLYISATLSISIQIPSISADMAVRARASLLAACCWKRPAGIRMRA
jgi:hypothetical protein